MSAMLQGVVKSSELEGINRIRLDCGLSAISAAQFNDMQMQELLQQQQQQSYIQQGEENDQY